MRLSVPVLAAAIAPLLCSCGQQEPAPNVDPLLGRACFAQKLQALPPGSQYEGVAAAAAGRLSIKVMNGVAVTVVDCELTPDGKLRL